VAIRLCDEGTALNKFPGWTASAWAYHSDYGKKYYDEKNGFEIVKSVLWETRWVAFWIFARGINLLQKRYFLW